MILGLVALVLVAILAVLLYFLLRPSTKFPPTPSPSSDYYQCQGTTCTKCGAQSPTCKYTEPGCDGECSGPKPTAPSYDGDGKASTTYFTAGESQGAGACGGCVYPGITNITEADFKDHNFENLYQEMKNLVTDGAHWTMAAASEAMMAPYCAKSIGMGCTGRANPTGATASAPCGTCWRLTREGSNKSLNVVIADACPCGDTSVCPTTAGGADNSRWCLTDPGVANSVGMYNHFDVWNATEPVLDWPSSGLEGDPVTFTSIPCPTAISTLMAQSCCGTYYDGSEGGSPQGCPNICGAEYTCPP